MTVNPQSKLALTAETLMRFNAMDNIKRESDGARLITPGTLTYTASMLGLFTAAIAIGERLGKLDASRTAALERKCTTGVAMAAADAGTAEIARKLARSITPDRDTVILGGGPNTPRPISAWPTGSRR